MPAFNSSVTHRIRHSYSYSTANGWLEDEEKHFFPRCCQRGLVMRKLSVRLSVYPKRKLWQNGK